MGPCKERVRSINGESADAYYEKIPCRCRGPLCKNATIHHNSFHPRPRCLLSNSAESDALLIQAKNVSYADLSSACTTPRFWFPSSLFRDRVFQWNYSFTMFSRSAPGDSCP